MNTHQIPPLTATALKNSIGPSRTEALSFELRSLAASLHGRRLINVTGDDQRKGGVFEMLRTNLPYIQGAGIEVAWLDLPTAPEARRALEFFHVLAHGRVGGHETIDQLDAHARRFVEFGATSAEALVPLLRPSDIVVLHDTQAAPLAAALGAWHGQLIWHSHIGTEDRNELIGHYWNTVTPLLNNVAACVFYRADYVPDQLTAKSVTVSPALDPSSQKSTLFPTFEARRRLVASTGLGPLTWLTGKAPTFAPDHRVGVQLSRWDPLKDMAGAAEVFCRTAQTDKSFVGLVVGPSAQSASEQHELARAIHVVTVDNDSPAGAAARVHIGIIDNCGSPEHDEMVGLVQSSADIVLQKSRQEGFGLTVTEAMLRSKAVIASAVGGIVDQIDDGFNGVLVSPEAPIDAWAEAVQELAGDPIRTSTFGGRARDSVLERYVVDRYLVDVVTGVKRLMSAAASRDGHEGGHRHDIGVV